jgi:phosphonate transport system substrate-binding protein
MKYRILRKICELSLLFLFSLQFSQADTATEPVLLKFGVVPQQAASKLAQSWSPILEYLTRETGYQLVFSTAPDIPTFESRLLEGEYDLAYMNPYHYVLYSINPGYRAFAHQKDKQLKGIIVVAKDSPLKSLKDLSGEVLAFPSPAAFAASLLPRANLKQQQVEFKPKYVGSHDSVYRTVAKGLYAAGGGIQRTFNALDSAIRDQLKILWVLPGYTPHAIAAHPRVPATIVNAIAQKMYTMDQTVEGKMLLSPILFSAIEEAVDSDWDDVRFLDMLEYNTLLNSENKP